MKSRGGPSPLLIAAGCALLSPHSADTAHAADAPSSSSAQAAAATAAATIVVTGAPAPEPRPDSGSDDKPAAPAPDFDAAYYDASHYIRALDIRAPDNVGEGADQCAGFAKVVVQAVGNDPRIDAAVAEFDFQNAELFLAKADRLPQLENFSRAGFGEGLQAENLIDNRIGLRLSQRVFGFGAGRFERKAAAARAAAAHHDIDMARLSVALEAAQAYMSLLRAKARRDATLEIEKYYARDAKMAQRRLEKNLLTIAEANTVFAEQAQSQARRAREELRIAQETERLSVLLGRRFSCGGEDSVSAFLDRRLPKTLEIATAEAITRSPALNAARENIRAEQAESRRVARAGLPQLSVGGTVAYDYDDDNNRFERNERFGFDLSAPLFQGGRNRSARRSAQARARRAAASLAREEQVLREHLAVSWARVYHLHAVLLKQIAARESFDRLSQSADREFALGALTLPELVDIKRDYYQAELSEIDVRFELYTQQLALVADAGRLLASNIAAPYSPAGEGANGD